MENGVVSRLSVVEYGDRYRPHEFFDTPLVIGQPCCHRRRAMKLASRKPPRLWNDLLPMRLDTPTPVVDLAHRLGLVHPKLLRVAETLAHQAPLDVPHPRSGRGPGASALHTTCSCPKGPTASWIMRTNSGRVPCTDKTPSIIVSTLLSDAWACRAIWSAINSLNASSFSGMVSSSAGTCGKDPSMRRSASSSGFTS